MTILKTVFKVIVATTLVLGGLLIGGTVFTAKKIDQAGDALEDKIHG